MKKYGIVNSDAGVVSACPWDYVSNSQPLKTILFQLPEVQKQLHLKLLLPVLAHSILAQEE